MKKNAFIALVITSFSLPALAGANHNTFTFGYAQSKVEHSEHINGVNLKYRYELNNTWGVMGSLSYLSGDGDYRRHVANDRIKGEAKVKNWSLLAGPTWRMNDKVSLYGLLGFNNAKVTYHSRWTNYVDESTLSESYLHGYNRTLNLAYGAGIQFTPYKDLAIDVGYEGSRVRADGRSYSINGFAVGVGYRF